MIPQYCPEWTDHNVSDPGVTLIELFAWMTDLLLYRVNQVPDLMYIKFLELIGVKLEEPRAAQTEVTFYLSAAQPNEVVIPAETEVATVRTETNPAIVFTTERDLAIRPPVVLGAYTGSGRAGAGNWLPHDLGQLGLTVSRIPLFPRQPAPGDAFYLALERDHSHHVLALLVTSEEAGGAGVKLSNPPIEWQVFQGGPIGWAPCTVDLDETGGFNRSGEIILHLPAMTQTEIQGVRAFWLRCRLTRAQADPTNSYEVSPDLEGLQIEARGGSVNARNAVTVLNEVLGRSEGVPGQRFKLLNTPLLERDPARDYLIVEPPDGPPQEWREVADFADSGPEDRHFTLDSMDGSLMLGPSLLQPNGTVYRFGVVPPRGSLLRFSRYQYGGGVIGNVPKDALTILKTSIPYVARITNRGPAMGGRDAQSIEDARVRAPQMLRTRTRAVTADDFEYLAGQVQGVARACCLAPGAQPDEPGAPRPGQVVVLVLPQIDQPGGVISYDQMNLSAQLREAVRLDLSKVCLLGVRPEVREPQFVWISVNARLRIRERSAPGLALEVQRQAEAALYRYLNPYVGGPEEQGWPFGRDLHVSEVYGLLQRIPGVEFVEDVQILVNPPGNNGATPAPPRLQLARDAVVCSQQHRIEVR